MARIKIGQIGVGHAHAAGKMEVYRNSAEFEVVGVAEPDADLRAAAEGKAPYQDLKWMTQEELLNVPGLAAVAVETRVEDLLDAAEASVAAGMHIHLDKPAGESLPQFKRILNEATRRHLAVQMGYMYRFNPGVVMLRDFLQRGWLGEPFEVHAVMSKVIAPGDRARLARFPGGIMFELGCHLVDLVVGLLGKPDEITPFPQKGLADDDGLVDNMLAVFRYPHALATVKSSALEVEGFARRHLTLCGTEGTLHIQPLDDPVVKVAFSRPRGSYAQGYQEVQFPKYVRYVDDAVDLARIIRGEKDPEYSYEHDAVVQQSVLAACGLSPEA
jgi:predicted dehydrogenase